MPLSSSLYSNGLVSTTCKCNPQPVAKARQSWFCLFCVIEGGRRPHAFGSSSSARPCSVEKVAAVNPFAPHVPALER
jgi:hypothetical protein